MPCIMAGLDQKDCCSGLYKAGFAGYDTPRAVFPSIVDCTRHKRHIVPAPGFCSRRSTVPPCTWRSIPYCLYMVRESVQQSVRVLTRSL